MTCVRSKGITTQEIGDECVVYRAEDGEVIVLNSGAFVVFSSCSMKTSLEALTSEYQE